MLQPQRRYSIKCEKDRHSLKEEKEDGATERSFSVRHTGYLEDSENSAGRKKKLFLVSPPKASFTISFCQLN